MIRTLAATLLAAFAFAAHANVDINKASQAELEAVKGIGTSMSTRIVDERKNGPFKDWADVITRVKGVGEGNAARFSQNGLTVAGASFNGAAPAGKPAKAEKAEKPAADKAK